MEEENDPPTTHGARVNHRIRCRDKIRAPGAWEKKQVLRQMWRKNQVAFSVWWAISQRLKAIRSEGTDNLGCQIDEVETIHGDPIARWCM